jgi:hypothetical protein
MNEVLYFLKRGGRSPQVFMEIAASIHFSRLHNCGDYSL